MTILALDTTSEHGSIALRRDGATVIERTIHSPDGFAHIIFGELENLKNKANLGSFFQIDCFAAAAGPGAFTGVRVGLSVIKGLAEAYGKPAVGISNLKALGSFGQNWVRTVVADARRNEVYAAAYDETGAAILPETVTKLESWLELLPPGLDWKFVSQNPNWLRTALASTRFAGAPVIEAPKALASAVAACAESEPWQDPAAIDANYVRRSDAELFWKD